MTRPKASSILEKGPVKASLRKVIRVRKEDSVFVYFILESHEGVISYSTLDHKAGEAHRDLELRYPSDLEPEALEILASLGELIYELQDR